MKPWSALGSLLLAAATADGQAPPIERVQRVEDRIELAAPIDFAIDRAELRAPSVALLRELAVYLNAHPELARVEISAHNDPAWYEPDRGLQLERARASSVVSALVEFGVERARLLATSYGADRPVVRCDPRRLRGSALDACRSRNRRIELRVVPAR